MQLDMDVPKPLEGAVSIMIEAHGIKEDLQYGEKIYSKGNQVIMKEC